MCPAVVYCITVVCLTRGHTYMLQSTKINTVMFWCVYVYVSTFYRWEIKALIDSVNSQERLSHVLRVSQEIREIKI